MKPATPNNALQRTRAALSLQFAQCEYSTAGCRRAPLGFRPLGARNGLGISLGLLLVAACTSSGSQCRNVIPPVAVQQPGPQVPPVFWDKHKDGVVVLAMRIQRDGSVWDPRVVSSPGHDYSYLALEAVRKWRYRAAVCDGQPVATELTVTMTFSHE